MPAVAHAGSESHVADRAVHRVGRRDEHFEPGIAREIRVVLQQRTFGKNILRQLRLRCFGRSVAAGARQGRGCNDKYPFHIGSLFEVLSEIAVQFRQRDCQIFRTVVEIDVPGIRNNEEFLGFGREPVCIFTELHGVGLFTGDEQQGTRRDRFQVREGIKIMNLTLLVRVGWVVSRGDEPLGVNSPRGVR